MSTFLLQCCANVAENVKCSCDFETATNWQDVTIIGIICGTIVIVAFIAKCTFLLWKDKEIKANKEERDDKKIKEKEESNRKQKADVQGKLLNFLEKQVSSFDTQKKEYEKACDMYKEHLELLIEKAKEQDKPEDNNIDGQSGKPGDTLSEELKDFLKKQIDIYYKKEVEYGRVCEEYKSEIKNIINSSTESK